MKQRTSGGRVSSPVALRLPGLQIYSVGRVRRSRHPASDSDFLGKQSDLG
ncbi:hypothetical protein O7047_14060 [Pseudenterobacter timonensis]|uniref:Uncharacterized protein n=1 Tax=Pseudenterobacter timonensis TaxID=1755099 RepID=A0AAE4DPM2_9ENTR|nr:hypothetical protein [Pseudenterobacter timonensis]MDR9891349.1 hypothetical protein [Pseudenterobacter timonensis]